MARSAELLSKGVPIFSYGTSRSTYVPFSNQYLIARAVGEFFWRHPALLSIKKLMFRPSACRPCFHAVLNVWILSGIKQRNDCKIRQRSRQQEDTAYHPVPDGAG